MTVLTDTQGLAILVFCQYKHSFLDISVSLSAVTKLVQLSLFLILMKHASQMISWRLVDTQKSFFRKSHLFLLDPKQVP
jgi:hypothetical protein